MDANVDNTIPHPLAWIAIIVWILTRLFDPPALAVCLVSLMAFLYRYSYQDSVVPDKSLIFDTAVVAILVGLIELITRVYFLNQPPIDETKQEQTVTSETAAPVTPRIANAASSAPSEETTSGDQKDSESQKSSLNTGSISAELEAPARQMGRWESLSKGIPHHFDPDICPYPKHCAEEYIRLKQMKVVDEEFPEPGSFTRPSSFQGLTNQNAIRKALRDLRDVNENLRRKLRLSNVKNDTLSDEIDNIRANATSACEDLKTANTELTDEHKKLKAEILAWDKKCLRPAKQSSTFGRKAGVPAAQVHKAAIKSCLKKINAGLKDRVEELDGRLGSVTQSKADLIQQLESANIIAQNQAIDVESLRTRDVASTRTLAAKQIEADNVGSNLTTKGAALIAKQAEADGLMNSLVATQKQVSDLNTELSALRTNDARSTETLTTIRVEVENLRSTLNTKDAEVNRSTNNLAAAQRQISDLNTELSNLRTNAHNIDLQLQQRQSVEQNRLDEVKRLREELERVQQNHRWELAPLRKQVADLRTDVDRETDKSSGLEQELAAHRCDHTQCEARLQSGGIPAGEPHECDHTVCEQRLRDEQISAVDSRTAALLREQNREAKNADTKVGLSGEIDRLKAKERTVIIARDNGFRSLQRAKERIEELEDQITSLQLQYDAVQGEKERFENEKSELQGQLNDLHAEIRQNTARTASIAREAQAASSGAAIQPPTTQPMEGVQQAEHQLPSLAVNRDFLKGKANSDVKKQLDLWFGIEIDKKAAVHPSFVRMCSEFFQGSNLAGMSEAVENVTMNFNQISPVELEDHGLLLFAFYGQNIMQHCLTLGGWRAEQRSRIQNVLRCCQLILNHGSASGADFKRCKDPFNFYSRV